MFGLMRVSTHERILGEVASRQRQVSDHFMDRYTLQIDSQMMRLRQIQDGEVERLRAGRT
jgi:hypothetical protein